MNFQKHDVMGHGWDSASSEKLKKKDLAGLGLVISHYGEGNIIISTLLSKNMKHGPLNNLPKVTASKWKNHALEGTFLTTT